MLGPFIPSRDRWRRELGAELSGLAAAVEGNGVTAAYVRHRLEALLRVIEYTLEQQARG